MATASVQISSTHRPTSYRKTPKVPRASTSYVPPVQEKNATLCTTTTSDNDRQYISGLCARFISHLFACPEASLPPPPSAPNSPRLDQFIDHALYRTRLHISVAFAALYLLQRLKTRFPAAKGSSGHRLFLSAFMLAAKIMCDDVYSNKSWAVVGQGMFALRELNQMEREMCDYLEFKLDVNPLALQAFEEQVRRDFPVSGPLPHFSKPQPVRTSSVVSASIPFNPTPPKRSAPPIIPTLPYRNAMQSPPLDTPGAVSSASTSPASSPSPATPVDADWARHPVRVVDQEGVLGVLPRPHVRSPVPKVAPGNAQSQATRRTQPIIASLPGPMRPTVPPPTTNISKGSAAGGREEYARAERSFW